MDVSESGNRVILGIVILNTQTYPINIFQRTLIFKIAEIFFYTIYITSYSDEPADKQDENKNNATVFDIFPGDVVILQKVASNLSNNLN